MKKEKLLTISVAAYNASDFLEKCISSCITKYLDEVEIIIVNDGSKDATGVIAEEYSQRYPQSVIAIDKDNGGYGSTVNTSMRLATGKYFKLLDSDDWFDKKGLEALLSFIREGGNADLILTDMVKVEGDTHSLCRAATLEPYKTILHDTCKCTDFEPGMWFSTIKTSLLKHDPFLLPEKRLYTDTLFMAYALRTVKTLVYLDVPVYYYLKGISTQSSSLESKVKYFDNYRAVYNEIMELCTNSDLEKLPGLVQRFRYSYGALIDRIFLLPFMYENKQLIRSIDRDLESHSILLFKSVAQKPGGRTIRLLRESNYNLYRVIKLLKDLR